jgi:hypothetical protein
VSDGEGGWVRTMTPVGSLVGSLQPADQTVVEQTVSAAERAEVRWQLFCDPGTDVRRDDVLVIAGVDYRVVSVVRWEASSVLDHMLCNLEQVQRGT